MTRITTEQMRIVLRRWELDGGLRSKTTDACLHGEDRIVGAFMSDFLQASKHWNLKLASTWRNFNKKSVFQNKFDITHERPPFSKFPLPIRTIFINNFLSSCAESNLNGVYCDEPLGNDYHGIFWEHWLGDYSLKASKMMVRPKDVWFSNPDDDLIELGNELGGLWRR